MATFNNTYTRDIPLSNLAADTSGLSDTYIIDQVLPGIVVEQYQGKIYKVDSGEDLRRQSDTKRAPGDTANTFSIDFSKPTSFENQDHAITTAVPIEIMAGADPIVARFTMMQTLPMVVQKIKLDREIKGVAALAAAVTATGVPSIKWDASTGLPIKNIQDQIVARKTASGVRPDALALDSGVLIKLSQSAEFKDRVKYTSFQPGDTGALARMLADACGLKRVIVADIALKNTAKKGQTASLSDIWGENVLLFKLVEPPIAGPNGAIFYSGLGVHTIWNANSYVPTGGTVGNTGGIQNGYLVETKYDDDRKSFYYRCSLYYDQPIINPTGAYWFTDTLT